MKLYLNCLFIFLFCSTYVHGQLIPLIPDTLVRISKLNDSLTVFSDKNLGVYNEHSGKIILNPVFSKIGLLNNELISAKTKEKLKIFDFEGTLKCNDSFIDILQNKNIFQQNFIVLNSDSIWQILDYNFNKISLKIDDIITSVNFLGYTAIRQGEKWQILSLRNEIKVYYLNADAVFYAEDFGIPLRKNYTNFWVLKNNYWQLCDTLGNSVHSNKYLDINYADLFTLFAKKSKGWSIIDIENGNELSRISYDTIFPFMSNPEYTIAVKKSKFIFLDNKAKEKSALFDYIDRDFLIESYIKIPVKKQGKWAIYDLEKERLLSKFKFNAYSFGYFPLNESGDEYPGYELIDESGQKCYYFFKD
jgi:hypothetical protein